MEGREVNSKAGALQLACLFLLALWIVSPTAAHELQPGTLSIEQVSDSRYGITWKAPIYYNMPHPTELKLPAQWVDVTERKQQRDGDYILHRFIVDVGEFGLIGQEIEIQGLEETITDVYLQVTWLDGTHYATVVRPAEPRFVVAENSDSSLATWAYLAIGVEHILLGFDHLTFVFALLLLIAGRKRLLITITAFTLAHSITLGLATVGLLSVPGPPVEAVIALSILFLAREIVAPGKAGLTREYPWLVAFVFGLLHGLGFAGALNDIGFAQSNLLPALVLFNVGVELGQIAFVLVVLALIALLRHIHLPPSLKPELVAGYAIGACASFWLVDRVVGFY